MSDVDIFFSHFQTVSFFSRRRVTPSGRSGILSKPFCREKKKPTILFSYKSAAFTSGLNTSPYAYRTCCFSTDVNTFCNRRKLVKRTEKFPAYRTTYKIDGVHAGSSSSFLSTIQRRRLFIVFSPVFLNTTPRRRVNTNVDSTKTIV